MCFYTFPDQSEAGSKPYRTILLGAFKIQSSMALVKVIVGRGHAVIPPAQTHYTVTGQNLSKAARSKR